MNISESLDVVKVTVLIQKMAADGQQFLCNSGDWNSWSYEGSVTIVVNKKHQIEHSSKHNNTTKLELKLF